VGVATGDTALLQKVSWVANMSAPLNCGPIRRSCTKNWGRSISRTTHETKAQATLEKAVRLEFVACARTLPARSDVRKRGEQEKAILYLQKALRYDANLMEARATLGKAYMRAGRPGCSHRRTAEGAVI